jgi:hypothetical protein
MSSLPNHRHEAFARALTEGMTPRQAFVAAGYTANLEAGPYKLGRTAPIRRRVKELQAKAAEDHGQTMAVLLAELDQARVQAMDNRQYAAAIAAIMGKGKLLGLLVEKIEDLTVRKPALIPTKATEMSEAEWLKMVNKAIPGSADFTTPPPDTKLN